MRSWFHKFSFDLLCFVVAPIVIVWNMIAEHGNLVISAISVSLVCLGLLSRCWKGKMF